MTNVDTTVSATNSVSLTTPGTMTLDGAEVDGESKKTVEQKDLPKGFVGTASTDNPDIISRVYSADYHEQYDRVGSDAAPVHDENGNIIFREHSTGDYFVFVDGKQQLPSLPQTGTFNNGSSQYASSIAAQIDPQTHTDIVARVEKKTALNDVRNSSLSYLLNKDGTFIGSRGTGAQILPPSDDPNATAEAFAKQAFGGKTPMKIKPVTVKGVTGGWTALFSDGTAVIYRTAGAASFRTPGDMATVEINTNSITILNGKQIKFKFPSR